MTNKVSAQNFGEIYVHQAPLLIFCVAASIKFFSKKISTARDDVARQSSKMGGPHQLHHVDVRITRWAPVTGDDAGAMCGAACAKYCRVMHVH